MAKINCPKDYNFWKILYLVGIQPDVELERFSYDEVIEVLQADVSQDRLDKALSEYNHQEWLDELEEINNPKINEYVLEKRIDELEMFILTQGGLV